MIEYDENFLGLKLPLNFHTYRLGLKPNGRG